MGGEAGARLAARLAMAVSADTLLRAACAAGRDAAAAPTPRVMAVDDWAWRRGHRYGTILVDLEQNTVVDLLPDRTAQTLAAWLRAHPGVEILAHDRASTYAEGARIGAPGAIQVADRWHMLRNLGETMRVIVERHHTVAQQVAREMRSHGFATVADAACERDMPNPSRPRRCAPPGLGRRMTAFAEALRLSGAGASISGIARQLHVDRKTLRRWISTGVLPSWQKPRRGRAIDVHASHLERRLSEGCRNAALLWRELRAIGFKGRYTAVRDWVARRRRAETHAHLTRGDGSVWTPPSMRRISRLLMSGAAAADARDARLIAAMLARAPALADTVAAARRIALLLRHRSSEPLVTVLEEAGRTLLRPFVATLRRDIAAVQASLDLPWTTSPAEGQISRLKMIKRTMYGRAGFDLLRARVLHAA